jgi:hypothetical protein
MESSQCPTPRQPQALSQQEEPRKPTSPLTNSADSLVNVPHCTWPLERGFCLARPVGSISVVNKMHCHLSGCLTLGQHGDDKPQESL